MITTEHLLVAAFVIALVIILLIDRFVEKRLNSGKGWSLKLEVSVYGFMVLAVILLVVIAVRISGGL